MSEERARDVLAYSSAKEMWDKLSRIYEQKSSTNKQFLHQKFQALMMETSESASAYITRVQSAAAALTEVGDVQTESAIVARIIG